MRTEMQANRNRAKSWPRAILIGAFATLALLAGVASRGYSDEPKPGDWLKLNENGEPCEVALADGMVLKLDTYGDEYEAYSALQPIDAGKKGKTIVDYEKLGTANVTCHSLQLDAAGGSLYWVDFGGNGRVNNIRRAALNGSRPSIVVALDFQHVGALAIDHERDTLYWANRAPSLVAFKKPPSARQAIWRAGLDGSRPEPVFDGLREPCGVAVQVVNGKVFYFDDMHLMCGDADTRKENLVLDAILGQIAYKGFNATIDGNGGKIYWSATDRWIARANLDGSEFELPIDLGVGGGAITGVAIDDHTSKLYWTDRDNQEIWRSNLNGSQAETIAVGLKFPSSIAIDPEHGYAYWTDYKAVRAAQYGLIKRMEIPRLPIAGSKPAPPLISSFEPTTQHSGGHVTLRGRHFLGTTKVMLITDDCRELNAVFKIKSDQEIELVIPRPGTGTTQATIVVQGPGGQTVTLPRDVNVIMGRGRRYDRLQDGKKFCYTVAPKSVFHRVEQSVVYAPSDATASAGGRGGTVMFLKNASRTVLADASDITIYHEPFARIQRRGKAVGDYKFVSVPAIRPSFVESLLKCEQPE